GIGSLPGLWSSHAQGIPFLDVYGLLSQRNTYPSEAGTHCRAIGANPIFRQIFPHAFRHSYTTGQCPYTELANPPRFHLLSWLRSRGHSNGRIVFPTSWIFLPRYPAGTSRIAFSLRRATPYRS